MIKLITKLPRKIIVALSGGVDSMAALDFFGRNHDVSAAFFHHGTAASDQAIEFVSEYCGKKSIPLFIGHLTQDRPRDQSWEEFWRDQRYQFLENLNCTVVTAHHLDDCVETYIWSSLHGQAKTIPVRRNNVVRPFLTTPKSQLESWCVRHHVPWCQDPTNENCDYMRNYIRCEIVPRALKVNPGLRKVVSRMVQKTLNHDFAD